MSLSRQERIQNKLSQHLQLAHILVLNESNRHNVPTGSETHFKVTIVSTQFEPLSKIARHRLVYQLLSLEFTLGLHALSLHLYTPEEWEQQSDGAPTSPPCRNGRHHD